MLLSGWFLTTLDDGFFEVDTSSFREIGGWTSGGVRGLRDIDDDLVSIQEFTGGDSLSGECSSISTSWALMMQKSTVELLIVADGWCCECGRLCRWKTCKMNWVEEQHAGQVSDKPPLMLKLVRDKDSWEKKSGVWFRRVFVCTFNLCYLLFYSCVPH